MFYVLHCSSRLSDSIEALSVRQASSYETFPTITWYGTPSQGISQFYLYTKHSSANGMNHTCLATAGAV